MEVRKRTTTTTPLSENVVLHESLGANVNFCIYKLNLPGRGETRVLVTKVAKKGVWRQSEILFPEAFYLTEENLKDFQLICDLVAKKFQEYEVTFKTGTFAKVPSDH